MNDGEQRFYLREIHPYWTEPRIVEERVTELADANLVERLGHRGSLIRLTREGARRKLAARPDTDSTLLLAKKPERSARHRQSTSRPAAPRRLA
jgi:hypothetical protein